MVLPWHNPVLLAEQAATLDLLSEGRLDFGVGKGYRYNEFAGFAIPLDEADARFEEALAIITKAWTSGQRFSHHGRFWTFNDILVEPPTSQKPHPPFWMAAGTPSSIRRVDQQQGVAIRRRTHRCLGGDIGRRPGAVLHHELLLEPL
jgi:alkanesulfonate monooxygenase SsuD/methylene tetrahydromethanopterin reductase-like flavin-dependent oxidoreductase (luciferase family)